MITVPAATPVTTPPETVAFELLALHTPPPVASVRVIWAPVFTLDTPAIVPAEPVLTVISLVTKHPDGAVYVTVAVPGT